MFYDPYTNFVHTISPYDLISQLLNFNAICMNVTTVDQTKHVKLSFEARINVTACINEIRKT